MATRSAASLPVPAPYAAAFDATYQALVHLGMNVRFADLNQGYIQASTSMGLASWGEDLDVRVRPTSPTTTAVDITSALKFGLIDWGKNDKNIAKIQTAIATALASAAPVPAPQAGAWHPDPSGRHELRWFDGQQWTESVNDAGATGTDPL